MAEVDVAYIVKYPKPGHVKTRLAADIGDEAAAAWYRNAAYDTFTLLRDHPACDVTVTYDPPEQAAAVREWLPDAPHYIAQAPGDLGDRLRAICDTLWEKNQRPILLVGGDCPGIDTAYLAQAIAALKARSHVIGPATDGGYVLLGLCGPTPEAFTDIAWSTEHVLSQTIERLEKRGESPHLLAPRTDVDTLSDLQKYEK